MFLNYHNIFLILFALLISTGSICATREYNSGNANRTILAKVTLSGVFEKLLTLSGGDDTSYAGMVIKDGVNWVKPNFKIHKINGTLNNYVILSDAVPVTHNFSPLFDTRKGVNPKHRYKALGGIESRGLIPYVSEDGTQWNKLQKDPVLTGRKSDFDSRNVAFWSEQQQLYMFYYRTWVQQKDKRYRSVARTTSKDFVRWTDPVEMDFGGTPLEQLYTNQTSPYFRAPHIYLGGSKVYEKPSGNF